MVSHGKKSLVRSLTPRWALWVSFVVFGATSVHNTYSVLGGSSFSEPLEVAGFLLGVFVDGYFMMIVPLLAVFQQIKHQMEEE